MPLMPDSESNFRLFLGDIGMFSYQSGINAASFVSSERENTLSGIFFENFIANELISIVENAGLMGLPLPAVITKAIDILTDKAGMENE